MTSWLAFDQDPTDCRLSIWYWPNAEPWTIGTSKHRPNWQIVLRFDLDSPIHGGDELILTECPHRL